MSLIIDEATVIDGETEYPITGASVWIEGGRIKVVGQRNEWVVPSAVRVIDGRGKFVIPGLMDANVHLLLDMRLENLVRYENRYADLICEAAQVALKNGVTTVFDTWGPRVPLIAVRDRINKGELLGSRIFCAGNIIGLGGPFSEDFLSKSAEIASAALVDRVNLIWTENVGPSLTWMTPAQVAQEVREYIGKGLDFIKYASSEHRVPIGSSAFLAFSPQAQQAIVEEVHAAGLTVQAHTQSVEALRVAIEAGCNIIQHCNITGPVAIPKSTLQQLVDRNTASTVFPLTQRRYEWFKDHGDTLTSRLFTVATVETNVANLIESGAIILLATDSGVLAAESATDAALGAVYSGEDNLFELGQGHFNWLKAMQEKGMSPMALLKSATRNIAAAYGKLKELGTIEAGKIADLLILDKNPLLSAENYRCIHMIIKDGDIVDRGALPMSPLLTRPADKSTAENSLRSRTRAGGLPLCCGF